MGFILWIVMGLIVGGVAGWVMRSSYPWYIDLLLGVVGAWLGGWLTSIFLGVDLTGGFNLTTFVVALVGAIILIFLSRLVFRGRSAL